MNPNPIFIEIDDPDTLDINGADAIGGAGLAVNGVFIGHVNPAATLTALSNVLTVSTSGASAMRVFTAKDVKFLVSNGKRVRFTRFIAADGGNLWYVTDDGFEFQVPVSETAGAVMLAEDKALYFMRHIVRHLKMLDCARENESQAALQLIA